MRFPSFALTLMAASMSLMVGGLDITHPLMAAQPPQPSQKISLKFKLPKRAAPVAGVVGGATRNFCVAGNLPLATLTPPNRLGLTTGSRPTFYLHVPQTSAKSAELVIKDINNQDVYRTSFPLDRNTSGIMSVQLPESAPPLEVNQYYRWYFSLVCRPSDRLEDVFVSAWVQRIEPDRGLAQALQQTNVRQRASLYAENGVWYDALSSLVQLRRLNPNDPKVTTEWSEFLESVGLE
ncbi:MAG: DUF928 domain-containing protein, partial [Leptolyngbyaceae bacterium]|nr:DUF928 domain-containing protein [Leptolyngbyaceae bacterium]